MRTKPHATNLAAAVACVLAVFGATSSHAIDKCKAKVDRKTGVITMDVAGAGGPVLWGATQGDEVNAFFNAGTCDKGSAWKRCQIGDPSTLAGKTPPASCTLYLDDGVAPCEAWISGCTPGPRELPALPTVSSGSYTPTWTTTAGFTAAPNYLDCDYSRTGKLVTVLCVFEIGPAYAVGENSATISVPASLPVENGPVRRRVSGEFINGFHTNLTETAAGTVSYVDSTSVKLKIISVGAGFAASWCSFTYRTDAP